MKRIRYLHKDTLERKPERHTTYKTHERKSSFMKKRFLSLFLALTLIAGLMPMNTVTANAAAEEGYLYVYEYGTTTPVEGVEILLQAGGGRAFSLHHGDYLQGIAGLGTYDVMIGDNSTGKGYDLAIDNITVDGSDVIIYVYPCHDVTITFQLSTGEKLPNLEVILPGKAWEMPINVNTDENGQVTFSVAAQKAVSIGMYYNGGSKWFYETFPEPGQYTLVYPVQQTVYITVLDGYGVPCTDSALTVEVNGQTLNKPMGTDWNHLFDYSGPVTFTEHGSQEFPYKITHNGNGYKTAEGTITVSLDTPYEGTVQLEMTDPIIEDSDGNEVSADVVLYTGNTYTWGVRRKTRPTGAKNYFEGNDSYLTITQEDDYSFWSITPQQVTEDPVPVKFGFQITQYNGDVVKKTATINVTVEKGEPSDMSELLSADNVEVPYDGNGHSIEVEGVPDGATILYSTDGGNTYSDKNPEFTNATNGAVTVHYKVTHADYKETTGSATVTIKQKEITVTADDKSKTYGDTDPTLTYTVDETTPLVSGESLSGISVTRANGEDATTYTITASQTDGANPNYDITFEKGTFTINQREIEFDWGGTEFMAYTGQTVVPEATATNLIDGDNCELTVSVVETADGAGIQPGKWTAKVAGVSNGNYKLPSNNLEVTYTIYGTQTAPTVSGVNETIDGKKDGKITDLATEMEYATKENALDNEYIKITDTDMTFAPGTYYVRYAKKDYYYSSADTTVVISKGRKLNVTVPSNQVGYTLTTADTELGWNGSTTITFALADGYSKTDSFAVKVDGNKVELTNNQYTISDVQANVVVTVEGVADITAPEVEMSVKGVGWKQFINKITFGLFFKENVEVKVEATDLGSKINKVEYLITETTFDTEAAVKADESQWTALTLANGVAKFNVTEKGKKYVYVRATDNAGNITVVSSDGGVVVYTDSTADTTSISYIKTTTDDVTANVNLNGNTVKAILNGTDHIDNNNYSVLASGKIIFKADYLDTLAEGSYTLHIVYNPQGMEYAEYEDGMGENINDAPAKTNITLNVGKQTGTVSIINDISKTYDGSTVTAPTYDRNNANGTVVVEYKKKGADDKTYSTEAPKTAGDYTVRVTVKADDAGFYTEAVSAPVDFTISKATLTVTVDNANANYGDAVPNYTVQYNGFKNGETESVLGGTLVFACDYAQFSDKGEYTIKASGYTSGNYNIGYVDGTLTVSAKKINVAINNATSVYGDPIAELTGNDNGIVNGDKNVYKLTTEATSTRDAGDYEIKGETLNNNYEITFMTESVSYTITKREITITVDAKNVVVNTALPTYTYKVDNLFGEDKLVTEPTLTSDADITVVGEYIITASGADAGSNYTIKYVPAKLTVLTDNAVDAARGYEEEIKDLDPDTVTSEDKAELTEILDEINTILDDDTITDNGKKALEETKEKVEVLIKEITDAEAATDTENIDKVKDTTSENVKPEDKTDLEGAKDDLEKALEDYGNNMTDDEKKAIEDEIKRIDDALEVIGNVENVEELIDKLPDTIKKDDADAIKAADDAYNALTDHEKTLVDVDAKKALDDAKAALAELNKPADSTSPNTGDNSNMFLWIALLFISGGAVITLTVVDRKKKVAK